MISLDFLVDGKTCTEDVEAAKAAIRAFLEKLAQYLKTYKLKAVWSMEFQTCGAPHFLMFADVPTKSISDFDTWCKENWCDIIGQSSVSALKYAALAKRAKRRVSGDIFPPGYMLKDKDDEQLKVPAGVECTGMMWGRRGIKLRPSTCRLSAEEGLDLRRNMSKYGASLPWRKGRKPRVPSEIRSMYVIAKAGGNYISRVLDAIAGSVALGSSRQPHVIAPHLPNSSQPVIPASLSSVERDARPHPDPFYLGHSTYHHEVEGQEGRSAPLLRGLANGRGYPGGLAQHPVERSSSPGPWRFIWPRQVPSTGPPRTMLTASIPPARAPYPRQNGPPRPSTQCLKPFTCVIGVSALPP